MNIPPPARTPRIHPAWWVAVVTFFTLIGAAGFRSTPGILIEPLHDEFGWSLGPISTAVSINLVLYGLVAPFSAALMERLGIARVTSVALLMVSVGAILPVWMTQSWQLILSWGILVGIGTGAMAMALVATVVNRWFVGRRGIVSGILTAAGATGQLIFLPVLANLAQNYGWRTAAFLTGVTALCVIPLVLWKMREYPATIGMRPYGASDDDPIITPIPHSGAARLAISALREAAGTRVFWALAISFAICGMTTNGLVGTHFIPAAHDHGMPQTTAAGLLALVGVFDVVGTIFSGWLTDRLDSRILLAVYYGGRSLSLIALPSLFGQSVHPSMFVFILFYGLDWVATVPPTMALCRQVFSERAPIVFGWIFASHQIGAALAAAGAGILRDKLGNYNLAWYIAGGLCFAATFLVLSIKKRATAHPNAAENRPRAIATGEDKPIVIADQKLLP